MDDAISTVSNQLDLSIAKKEDQVIHEENHDVTKQDETSKERRRRMLYQAGICSLSSIGMWAVGTLVPFPSVVANDLSDHNTTIFGNPISLTDTQMDMLGSLLPLFGLPGCWISAFLAIRFGRRPSMAFNGVIIILGWLGVVFLPGALGLLLSRAVSGLACGMDASMNAYGIEIPDPDVRGRMYMIIKTGILVGQVVTLGLGYSSRYYIVALINLIFPTIFLVSLIWLPESPSYLVIKGHTKDARALLLKLRGPHIDLDSEINDYQSMNKSDDGDNISKWKGLLAPKVLRSIGICCILFILMNFTGYTVVNVNASRIFKEAGSTVDESLAAIIVTLVQIGAGVISTFFIDSLGRKKSLMLSYFITCIALVVLALYLGLADVEGEQDGGQGKMYGWIPLVCLIVSQAAVVLGVYPIPYILSNEYFPTSLRSQASSICITADALSSVAVLQLYTPMKDGLTQAGLFGFYSSVSVVGFLFSYFFVKETMGKQIG